MFEIQNLSKVIFLSKAVSPASTHSSALKRHLVGGQAIFNCLFKKKPHTQNLLQSNKENQMHLPRAPLL